MFLRLLKTSEGSTQREVPLVPHYTRLWLLLCPLQPHDSDAFCCDHSKEELAHWLMASKFKAQLWWHNEKLSTSPSEDGVLLTDLGSAFFLAFSLVLLLFLLLLLLLFAGFTFCFFAVAQAEKEPCLSCCFEHPWRSLHPRGEELSIVLFCFVPKLYK